MAENAHNETESKLVSLVAQFDDPDQLVHACDSARQDGYKAMDAYTPFPIHGIDQALGIRRTLLPFFVLSVGLGACLIGLGLQWYTNATDDWWPFPGYGFRISGKPMFSLPANIPVTFEIIVLSSAFATFFGMWIRNGYPRFANPLQRISRFKRATDDRFFLVIEAKDEKFNESEIRQKFSDWGASEIDECRLDQRDQQMPAFVKTVLVLLVVLAFLPPVMVYRSRGMTNRLPRFHFNPDMDWQEKYKAQSFGPKTSEGADPWFFSDERSMRPAIEGTLARGDLETDFEYYNGYVKGTEPKIEANAMTTLTSARQEQEGDDQEGAGQEGANEGGEENQQDNQDDSGSDQSGENQQSQDPPEPQWITSFPKQLTIDEEFIRRGKQRFEIYCTACHGYGGDGNGLVNQRALGLALSGKAAWTTAKSLHDPEVVSQDIGRIFDTITNGRSTMGPYQRQIPTRDRWAIVAYVKALQVQGKTRDAYVPPVVAEPGNDESSNDGESSGNGETDGNDDSADNSEGNN